MSPLLTALAWHREYRDKTTAFRALHCVRGGWRDGRPETCRSLLLDAWKEQRIEAEVSAANGYGMVDLPGPWLDFEFGDDACGACIERHILAAELKALRARKPGVMSAMWSHIAKLERAGVLS